MNCAQMFAYANEEACFAVIEDTCGTLKKPTDIIHRLFTVGPVDFEQNQEFLEDEQIREGASKTSRIKGRKLIGDWNANSYVKPSGTPGLEPEHDVLFQSALGAGALAAGPTYEYTLANQLDSFSLWVKKGHTVFAFRGATVETLEALVTGEAIAGLSWAGKFMEQLMAGTTVAVGTYDGGQTVITLRSGSAERFDKGMYITFGESAAGVALDTNNGAGYLITGVNQTNDKIIVSPALNSTPNPASANPVVNPWWPAGGADLGDPQHGKMGMVLIESRESVVLSARVTLVNNIKYYENEKNNVWTAERFGRPKTRSVEGEIEINFLEEGPSYFYRAAYQIPNELVIPVGNVSGYIMEIHVPYAEYGTPRISGDEEFKQNLPFIGVIAGTQNTEMKIVFK